MRTFSSESWLEDARQHLSEPCWRHAKNASESLDPTLFREFSVLERFSNRETSNDFDNHTEFLRISTFTEEFCQLYGACGLDFLQNQVDRRSPPEYYFLLTLLCLAHQQAYFLELNGKEISTNRCDPKCFLRNGAFTVKIATQVQLEGVDERADFRVDVQFPSGSSFCTIVQIDSSQYHGPGNAKAMKRDTKFNEQLQQEHPCKELWRLKVGDFYPSNKDAFHIIKETLRLSKEF